MSRLSPINQARWARFCSNRRGYWSLWIFLVLFIFSLGANLIANDRPLLVRYQGNLYLPFIIDYSETIFGGELNTATDYQDPFVIKADRQSRLGSLATDSLQLRHYQLRHRGALPFSAFAPKSVGYRR